MSKIYIKTATADIDSGPVRAYIVQKHEVIRKPSKRIQKLLARHRAAETVKEAAITGIKGVYAGSIIFAMLAGARLLETGPLNSLNLVRAIACVIWAAVPVAVYVISGMKKEG